jgi:hypothetical protein
MGFGPQVREDKHERRKLDWAIKKAAFEEAAQYGSYVYIRFLFKSPLCL